MDKILQPVQKQYLDTFKKESDPIVKEMEEYALKNSVPILSSDAAEFMEILIRLTAPRRVLEIGTAIAYSSIRIARNLKKKGVVHTIEKSKDNITIAEEYIAKSGLQDKIKIFSGNAEDIMPGLEKKYDFIFLDADKEDYLKLFGYSLKLLKKRGIIFVDNLLWHGYAAADKVPKSYEISTQQIREFNIKFMNHKFLKTIIVPIGDGIGIGIKEQKNNA
jgi:predicted O-methyltransferase YrrM